MNRRQKIGGIVLWALLVAYLILAAVYCSRREADRICTGLNITIKDSARIGLISGETVRNLLVNARMKLTGARLDTLDGAAVERLLARRTYIKSVRVYTSLDDRLNIEVEQRTPVARVQTENGYRFFLSDDGYVMPLRWSSPITVPIVTGTPALPFGIDFEGAIPREGNLQKKSSENENFLWNLINFVQFLEHDSFWHGQIVQICANEANEVELIPRIGRGVIGLGELEGYREKLDKLYMFYTKGLAYEGWNKYAYIDLRYAGQVVCTE
jgi:cell division protein FtsQ